MSLPNNALTLVICYKDNILNIQPWFSSSKDWGFTWKPYYMSQSFWIFISYFYHIYIHTIYGEVAMGLESLDLGRGRRSERLKQWSSNCHIPGNFVLLCYFPLLIHQGLQPRQKIGTLNHKYILVFKDVCLENQNLCCLGKALQQTSL